MNVVIAGLTAAGKTTHARLIADYFDMRYVSASQVLAANTGIDVDPEEHWWLEHGKRLSAARERSDAVDTDLDKTMVHLAENGDHQVFDAWALPWTSAAPMLRIWLESDPASRYRKCRVSHLGERLLVLDECKKIVDTKDDESRRIFGRLHGFDLYRDHHVFDVILDLSQLIPEATDACSRRGIATADAFLREVVGTRLGATETSEDGLRRASEALPTDAIVRLR